MERTSPTPKTVLVIDDEAAIVEIIQTVLEGEGYRVYGTISPLEGVEIYRQHWPSIALVISDFRMPQIYGDEVLKRLRCINPKVALLLVTGSKEFLPTDFLKQGLRGLVEKPFRLNELVKQVNESVASVAL